MIKPRWRRTVIKPIIKDRDLERTNSLDIDRIEIVIDEYNPEKVELYILDQAGDRIEGGTFDRASFMNHIVDFYNKHY